MYENSANTIDTRTVKINTCVVVLQLLLVNTGGHLSHEFTNLGL